MTDSSDEKRLAEWLISTGKLSLEELEACFAATRQPSDGTEKSLGSVLVEQGHLSSQGLQTALSLSAPQSGDVGSNSRTSATGAEHQASPMSDTCPDPRTVEIGEALADPSRQIGRYAKLDELGRGGMGVVYRGYDPQLKRSVAIKMIHDTGDAEDFARFQREARATARLQHPGIVTVHEVGEHEGHPFLVMDLVEGEDLEELLMAKNLASRPLLEIIRDVAQALHHGHQAGVIHRDVKPHNIMIDAEGRPRLMDFGLARDTSARQQLTRTGQIMGTPAYMAPEQVDSGLGDHGPWTDVYGLGAVMYRALTGRNVFQASNAAALLNKVLTKDPVSPRLLEHTITFDLETIILKCLEKEPPRRYPSAAALADEIQRLLDGQAILARPVRPIEKATRWMRRNRALSTSLTALALVSTVAVAAVGHVVTTAPTPVSENESKTAQGWLELGTACRLSKDLDGALQHFTSAINLAPDLAMPWHARGNAHQANGDLESAIADWQRFLDLAPQHQLATTIRNRIAMAKEAIKNTADGWTAKGESRLTEGDTNGAIEAFTHAIERDPLSTSVWLQRATSLKNAGIYDSAIDDYTRAIEIDPECVEAWTNRGRTRALQQDFDGAIKDATHAIDLAPNQPTPWCKRGLTWLDQGEFDKSIADYTRAIEIDPDHGMAWFGRGNVHLRRLDFDAAINDYTRLLEIHPRDATAFLSRGFARKRKGHLNGAIADWQRFLTLAPNHSKAPEIRARLAGIEKLTPETAEEWIAKGKALYAKRDIAGAIVAFSTAIEIEPERAQHWIDRAHSRIWLKDFDGAISDFSQAIELNPDRWAALSSRGRARASLGDYEAALRDCTLAIEKAPEIAISWRNRGLTNLEQRNSDAAINDFSQALKLRPSYSSALTERGRAREQKGDFVEALADHTRAIEQDQSFVTAWYNRGRVRLGMGNLDGAISDFTRVLDLAPAYPMALLHRGNAYRKKGLLANAITDLGRFVELKPKHNKTPAIEAEIQDLRQQQARKDAGADK